MKLPRGTFHSIKKGILFRSLLDEMEKTRFTGYCTVSWGIDTCTLVLNSGIYILADFDKSEGEPAWQKMQKLLELTVDASLTSLNTIQLELAREFNPHATLPSFVRKSPNRQVRTGISSPGIRKRDEIQITNVADAPPVHQKKQVRPGDTIRESTHKLPANKGPSPVTTGAPGDQLANDTQPDENYTNIDRDLEALDNMDLDEMTKKMRENFKVTIENLNLDHLIEKHED
jgi:hypothetical protein